MCNTCGLHVNDLSMDRGVLAIFPHRWLCSLRVVLENHTLIPILHIFYTQFFTRLNLYFQSVILSFYTVCTPLIITKTIYIK